MSDDGPKDDSLMDKVEEVVDRVKGANPELQSWNVGRLRRIRGRLVNMVSRRARHELHLDD
jgi:hypothetical protein